MKNLFVSLILSLIAFTSFGQSAEDKKLALLKLQPNDWVYILSVTPQVTVLKKETDTVRARLMTNARGAITPVAIEAMEQGKIIALYRLITNEPYHAVKDYMPRLVAAFNNVSPYVSQQIKYADEVNKATFEYRLQSNKMTLNPPRRN